MKKQSQQIQTRDVEGPFDHIRTCVCSPLKITFSVGTLQYKVAIGPFPMSTTEILIVLTLKPEFCSYARKHVRSP